MKQNYVTVTLRHEVLTPNSWTILNDEIQTLLINCSVQCVAFLFVQYGNVSTSSVIKRHSLLSRISQWICKRNLFHFGVRKENVESHFDCSMTGSVISIVNTKVYSCHIWTDEQRPVTIITYAIRHTCHTHTHTLLTALRPGLQG